ncbi:ADP-ribosylation factor [Seiridium cupressi]
MAAQEPVSAAADIPWLDFDDEAVFEETLKEAAATTCQNFVLEFGSDNARIVRDLQEEQFETLLNKEDRDSHHPIRWINIWDTSAYKKIVKLVGSKYAFSQRLISLMIYAKEMQQYAAHTGKKKNASAAARKASALNLPATNKNASAVQIDPEKGLTDGSSTTSPTAQTTTSALPPLEGEEIDLYLLLKDTVNYSSTDHTDKAICVGAHWLYKRPHRPGMSVENDPEEFMPPKHWLWLVLCDDHTVITLHESPKIESAPKEWSKDEWQQAVYKSIRANSLDVLAQQSLHGMKLYDQRPLSQNSIRQELRKLQDRSSLTRQGLTRIRSDVGPVAVIPGTSLEDEGTSNLFYYLFEDYSAAGRLKKAGHILAELTPKVLSSVDRKSRVKIRDIIQPLHYLSKDLRNLKHLFENYMIIIGKVLAATSRPGSPAPDPRASMLFRTDTNLSESFMTSSDPDRKVFLASSALQRFDRLRDRVRGFMLNTIDGHIEEISALQATYFNLTQQKDSAATARLTRSATLLAKLSVFFLPISFITSFFSVQIEDMFQWWTSSTYWITFGITAGISFICLFFFGRMLMFFSDVLDDWAEKISDWCRMAVRSLGLNLVDEDDDED